MIVLGIDPGIAKIGYGVIKKTKSLKCLDYGTIKTTPSFTMPERLRILNNKLSHVIKKYQPEILVVENVYFHRNLKTAIPVSQAEGVILLTAAKKKMPVCQFTPLQVKMAITGYGRAKKKRVQKKIKSLLRLKKIPQSDDAVDALAIALTYILRQES
jgi:crossover junction endodeoxyribonuclease RuvC